MPCTRVWSVTPTNSFHSREDIPSLCLSFRIVDFFLSCGSFGLVVLTGVFQHLVFPLVVDVCGSFPQNLSLKKVFDLKGCLRRGVGYVGVWQWHCHFLHKERSPDLASKTRSGDLDLSGGFSFCCISLSCSFFDCAACCVSVILLSSFEIKASLVFYSLHLVSCGFPIIVDRMDAVRQPRRSSGHW